MSKSESRTRPDIAAVELTDLLFDEPGAGRCLAAPDGRIVRVNAEWLRFAGAPADQVLGTDVAAVLGSLGDAGGDAYARARAGQSSDLPPHDRLVQGRQTSWTGTVSPVAVGGGTGVLVTVRQATAHDTFRHLVEQSPFGVYAVDADFRLVQVSAGAQKVFENVRPLLGRDFADVIRTIWEEPFATEAIGRFRHTLATGEPYHAPSTIEQRRDTAQVESYDWKIERVMLPDGRFGVVCHFYDLSERQRYEEALREADRRKSEFLAVLSHELRNPLAPIRTGVYLLEKALPGSDQATRAREVIRRQTDHLTRLIDDLLDVTRISRGKVILKPERLDLREVVRKTTDDLRPLFEEHRIELRVQHATGPVWVNADRTRISQVIGNVLQNSLKFTPSGGLVTVQIAADGGRAELRILDTGVGIEADQLERMFEPFAQAEDGLARSKGGLGLGLSLVKALTELQGGTVTARSQGSGHGAEFIIGLPLAAENQAASPAPRPSPPSGGSRRIVVIEDNVDAGDMLAEMLTLEGHQVWVARSAGAGIALVRETKPDVVLCDIGLPDMDGYAVARTIRQDHALASVRIVGLSGYAQPEDRQRSTEAGFDVHIAKPPNPDELLRALMA